MLPRPEKRETSPARISRSPRPDGMLHRDLEACGIGRIRLTLAFVKRLLVGRPLATTEMEHQRIPKTIALAVFSSDAISSTAYATEEILFVVATGASSLALGLSELVPIGIVVAVLLVDRRHVVPPDDLRLPERRRQLHRESREPRRDPVARRRRVAARRLHPHRCGVDLGRCRRDRVDSRAPQPGEASRAARARAASRS